MKPLKIILFGIPRLERAGTTVDISRRKVAALMAFLAATGQPQSRDALAALLWPDYDQSSARANLRRDLSRLKQLMGDEYLKVDRNQAEITVTDSLELDVRTFRAAVEDVRRHHPTARQLCEACAGTLSEAVTLYQDDFLAGFGLPDSASFEEWQFFQSEGLRQMLAEALQRLIDWHVSHAQYERALEYARRWVALDALHEPAQRRLMQLYAWSGQQAAALRQYREAARLLQEDLGVAPEEETQILYEAIRNRRLAAPNFEFHNSNFEIKDLLAVGGHAEVYFGRDRKSGADVVIKRLKPELIVKDAAYLERFIREATALSRLEHPNIVRMLATFEEGDLHNIVMEYVPGGSLRQLLDEKGPLPVERAVSIALELADALARAHHLNIIHRDLKPDNVLLAADGTPRLTDFGLARLRRDDVRLTRTGAVMGSPAYMSPEALRGGELDPRSDIWSFGVLLYEMLAGRKPFEGQQLTPVLVSILHDEALPVTAFRPNAPPALVSLLQRMLQKEPQQRPASMRQVAAELESVGDRERSLAYYDRSLDDPHRHASPLRGQPAFVTPLVGRQSEIAEIGQLLGERAEHRLLTLLGPGGIGKTRLAIAAAAVLAPAFKDGGAFVDLAPLPTPEHIVSALADSLELAPHESVDRRQQLLNYLRERQMLLVLDNFEYLLDGAELIITILSQAQDVKIMITSRERLNLSEELLYPLRGLDFPFAPVSAAKLEEGTLRQYSAVDLFLHRARMVAPGLTPDADDLRQVVRICQLVQGMPLLLLLAASWISVLTLSEIAEEIGAGLDILESDMRDLPPRQRSARAVFESSWKLLGGQAQSVLAALSVFRGGFDRHAAEAVAGASLRTLLSLLHTSWLQGDHMSADMDRRFHIHELLRQYAAEKLAQDAGQEEVVRQRHAAYYGQLLESQLASLRGPLLQAANETIAANFDNVYLAWRWFVQRRAFAPIVDQMLPALFRFCETRPESFTLLQLLEEALVALSELSTDTLEAWRATLLTAQGAFYRHSYPVRFETFGMAVVARDAVVREAWSLAKKAGGIGSNFWDTMLGYVYGRVIDRREGVRYLQQLLDRPNGAASSWERAFALHMVALLKMARSGAMDDRHFEAARHVLSEALALFEKEGDAREGALCVRSLGQLQRLRRHFTEAIELWTAAQTQLENVGERTLVADINWQIGDAYIQMGRLEDAFPYYRRMCHDYLSVGHKQLAAMVLSKESYEAARYGKRDYARERREEALALAVESGDAFAEAWNRWEMGELLRLEGDSDQARIWFEQARALFQEFGDANGATFYHRGLGDLALLAGRYDEARREFEISLQHAESTGHAWAMAYALAGVSMALTKLQQAPEARARLTRAVQVARELGDRGVTLRVLLAAAYYYRALGDDERALELAAFVAHHPISWQENRGQAMAIVDGEAAAASAAHIEAPSQHQDFWELVDQLRHDLEASDVEATARATH